VQEQAQLSAFLVKPITAAMMLEAVADAKAGRNRLRSRTRAKREDSGGSLRGMHLLVVEDNPINQQVARELLVSEGARVHVADNGLLGVAAVAEAKTPFHAVLMDVQMPVMDGYAATHAIRHELKLPDLPVIAMTANAMASDRAACLEAGMNDHVGKPFDLTHLVSVLLSRTGFQPPVVSTTQVQSAADAASPQPGLTAPAVQPAHAGGMLLDTQTALQRLAGMKPLYVRLAREFHADLQKTVPEYRRLIAGALLSDAVRQMHTLKGTAATLGALQLSEFARALEARCRESSQEVLQESQVDQLQSVVDATREALVSAIAELGAVVVSNGAEPPESLQSAPERPTDRAAQTRSLLAILANMENLLARSDLQALESFSECRAQLEAQGFDQFAALEQAFQDLDLSAALEACRAMAAQLESVGA
jgi:CheY-like chemotaxis protein